MRNYIVFGTIDTRDYGVYISGNKRNTIPQRPYEIAQIPGRMGDLITGGDYLANETLTYPAFFAPVGGTYGNYATYEEAVSAFRNALLSTNGYAKLTDTYDTTHYRKAVFTGPVAIDTNDKLDAGSFELVFSAKPQRYIVGGDTAVTVAANTSQIIATNGRRSEPIVEVTGTGTFYFNAGKMGGARIVQNTNKIVIDSERKTIYDTGFAPRAEYYVNLTDYAFPYINKPFGIVYPSFSAAANGCSLSIVFNWFEL